MGDKKTCAVSMIESRAMPSDGSAVDDALNCVPYMAFQTILEPPFDRARICRNWAAMVNEIKRLRLEVERLSNSVKPAPNAQAVEVAK